MVRYLVSKKGIPVLASVRGDGAVQPCCVLVAKYCDEPLQISFFLKYTCFIDGFGDEQSFTLIYDADNLIHGATSLQSATTPLPHHQLTSIARAGNPQMRVLTLTLAKPCRIRCPPTPGIGTLTPKNGHEAAFHQLVKLAKATEINVLLDYNWIHADNREPLNRFFREPNAFAGFPDGNDGYTYVDWAVFDTTEEQDAPPPSYANAVDTDASRKRSRHGKTLRTPISWPVIVNALRVATTRSPSTSPALKRHHYDPGSPTEIATATPSPRPPHTSVSSPLEKATASHTSLEATAALAFQTAINRAVEAQLPALVERMLPSILNTMLPDILHDMLAPQRSLSLSPPPVTTPPPRFASSSLGNTITDRLTELAKQHLTTIFDEASDQAYSLRAQADGDFEDVIADHKINVDSIKEDCIRELGEVVDEKLDRFKEQTDELIESAVEEMENKSSEVCEGIYDGLETFLNGASATLKNVRGGKTSGTRCTVRS
ncbi:hypothetical protein G6011_06786 [Alternaria panax]|uniref:Uncharacterized protein n=1 Tax=Alternaria panax TaxID=48097 RepID=A0AAD4FJ58_9PLEO|nr:hypothetical protein G6011_06786 [Alternaria panax]